MQTDGRGAFLHPRVGERRQNYSFMFTHISFILLYFFCLDLCSYVMVSISLISMGKRGNKVGYLFFKHIRKAGGEFTSLNIAHKIISQALEYCLSATYYLYQEDSYLMQPDGITLQKS